MSTTQERRLARAKKWLRDRWNNGGFSFADTAAMLVEQMRECFEGRS